MSIREEVRQKRCRKSLRGNLSHLSSFRGIPDQVADILSVHFVPFHSYYPLEDGYGETENRDYYLRFYLPLRTGSITDLFIMFNGLGDAGPLVYDDLGLQFAKVGVASVLFPLPCHYHRRADFVSRRDDIFEADDPDESRACSQAIVSEIAQTPEILVHMYRHIMIDMLNFLSTVSLENEANPLLLKFCSRFFRRDTRLHLLGYSLGGLTALALMLRNPQKFESCHLVESGACLEQINAGVLFERNAKTVNAIWKRRIAPQLRSGSKTVDDLKHLLVCPYDGDKIKKDYANLARQIERKSRPPDVQVAEGAFVRQHLDSDRIWKSLVRDVVRIYHTKHSSKMTQEEADIFEKIVLGDHKILYKDDLAKRCTKILIILGGSDVVFQMDAIMSFSPRETGLAILQIPGLGHWLKFSHRDVWSSWKGFIVSTILEFARTERSQ